MGILLTADAAANDAANAAMGGMSWFTIIWLVVIVRTSICQFLKIFQT